MTVSKKVVIPLEQLPAVNLNSEPHYLVRYRIRSSDYNMSSDWTTMQKMIIPDYAQFNASATAPMNITYSVSTDNNNATCTVSWGPNQLPMLASEIKINNNTTLTENVQLTSVDTLELRDGDRILIQQFKDYSSNGDGKFSVTVGQGGHTIYVEFAKDYHGPPDLDDLPVIVTTVAPVSLVDLYYRIDNGDWYYGGPFGATDSTTLPSISTPANLTIALQRPTVPKYRYLNNFNDPFAQNFDPTETQPCPVTICVGSLELL